MEAPDKIYLERVYPDNGVLPNSLHYSASISDIEYIRKDLLLEWANELTSEPYDGTTESAHKHQIANYLREKYNSL